ncbi:hypothetical protein B0A55_09324 [Friedmanniomyces simplex]|uniref:Uncharacterized protein n=1 Tax=Friedmanniomyces simplex TaxID=329884 RepID=A0A4U0WWJ1_9PEZI|nr:hypothetical protein B0A55_09324 [Friedmanniomyces simplex]
MFPQAVAAYWRPSKEAAACEPDAAASLFYTVLPTLIQRRVPKIPSLRRTASTYRKAAAPTAHERDDSDSSSESSVTPPPSYHTSARTSVIDAEYDAADTDASHSFPPSSRPTTSGSAAPTYHTHQGDSGVQWKYAKQGFSLLARSAQEESLLREQDPGFGRKFLRTALPESLGSPVLGGEVFARSAVRDEGPAVSRQEQREVSTLHEAVASMTLHIFLVLSFILPYIQLLLQQAYQYDRRYSISDKVVAQSYFIAVVLGQQLMTMAAHIGAMNEGQIGVVVRDAGLWWLRGVSGGLYDGVGEGMQALRLKNEKSIR